MADFVDIRFTGSRELQAKLKRLDIALQRRIVRAGMRQGMKPVLADAKQLAPFDTGALEASLKIRSKTRRGVTKVSVVTGTRDELGIPADAKGFYPAVHEYGSAAANILERSFMRKALFDNKTDAIDDLKSYIAAQIERIARS